MVSGVQNGNLLQSVRAEQAFKKAARQTESLKYDFASDGLDSVEVLVEDSSDVNTSQNTVETQNVKKEKAETQDSTEFKSSLLEYKKDFVSDFKNFINKIGNFNVKDEDIDYALRYGKSILVDQQA